MVDQRVGLRREVRKGSRSARRVLAGARGLSGRSTAAWLWERARRQPSLGADENSSFTWITATDTETTLLWLHNYWSDAYKLPSPTFVISLLDTAGAAVATWDLTLEPDATEVIDVRQVCRDHGVALPFEGQALLVLHDEAVVPGRPVQLFAEYCRDDGEATGVHGQMGLMRAPLAQLVGGVRVDPDPSWRNGVVVVNAYDGPGGPAELHSHVEVIAADGEVRRAALGTLAPRASARVYLDEVVPDLVGFLGGRPGQMRVSVPYAGSRAATFVEARDGGRRVVNHATIDRSFDQGLGVPPGWTRSQPVASVLVLADDHRDTVLTLPNVWGPRSAAYPVEVRIHAADGTLLVRHEITVARRATRDVSLRDLLRGAGVALPVVAHAEVRVGAVPSDDELPAVLDFVVGVHDDGATAGEVQVGGEFFNAEVPPGVSGPDIRRTRVFTRVRQGEAARTWIFLAYPAPIEADPTLAARPVLTLLDPTGQRRATAEVDLPVHGCTFVELHDLFGAEVEAVLSDGVGALRVRDTTARLYGYHLVETDGARSVAIDHLVGG